METAQLQGGSSGIPGYDEDVARIAEQFRITPEQVQGYRDQLGELIGAEMDRLEASGQFYQGMAELRDRAYRNIEAGLQRQLRDENNAADAMIVLERDKARLIEQVQEQSNQQQERLRELNALNAEQNNDRMLELWNQYTSDVVQFTDERIPLLRAQGEAAANAATAGFAEALAAQTAEIAEQVMISDFQKSLDTLFEGFAMGGDIDRRTSLAALMTEEFNTMDDAVRAVTDALSDQEQQWMRLNEIGIGEYIKLVEESKEKTREAFREDAIDGFTSSIESIGEFLGQTLVQSFDDGLTGAERAKAFLAGMLGDFLKTIGSTAIAQGAIVAFGDPAPGGFPNPARAA